MFVSQDMFLVLLGQKNTFVLQDMFLVLLRQIIYICQPRHIFSVAGQKNSFVSQDMFLV